MALVLMLLYWTSCETYREDNTERSFFEMLRENCDNWM
jgi:hypothetical protein